MRNLFKIAIRNLFRYKRRTLLTVSLITIGVVFVLGYIAVAGSFKNMMVAQITDSSLGHLQVHRQGYMAAVESLPLTMNLRAPAYKNLEDVLKSQPEVESYSPRIRLGGMFSTFVETTSIRLNGVYPDREFKTVPLLPSRIIKGEKHLNRGEILVPELLANGMGVKPGDTVVLVATNKDGSVNGMQFKVSGDPRKRPGTGRKGRLYPFRGRLAAPAHARAGSQRGGHPPERLQPGAGLHEEARRTARQGDQPEGECPSSRSTPGRSSAHFTISPA